MFVEDPDRHRADWAGLQGRGPDVLQSLLPHHTLPLPAGNHPILTKKTLSFMQIIRNSVLLTIASKTSKSGTDFFLNCKPDPQFIYD